MAGFMPGAVHEPIPAGDNDPEIDPVGVILHVAVSKSTDIRGVFTDGRGIESHFYVTFEGTIIQYRSIYREADAQFDGNSFTHAGKLAGFVSVETAGMGPGKWTAAQLASIRRIIAWVHSQRPFPLRVCPAWNAPGVGYHSLFDQWNHNAHSCPGVNRIRQFRSALVPWLARLADHHAAQARDSRGENVDHAIRDLRTAARRQPRHRTVLQHALRVLRTINPFTRKDK